MTASIQPRPEVKAPSLVTAMLEDCPLPSSDRKRVSRDRPIIWNDRATPDAHTASKIIRALLRSAFGSPPMARALGRVQSLRPCPYGSTAHRNIHGSQSAHISALSSGVVLHVPTLERLCVRAYTRHSRLRYGSQIANTGLREKLSFPVTPK